MAFNSLEAFVNVLDKENELIRITSYVNPELEITEITDRFSKQSDGGKALLFENTGTDFPVLINAFGSLKRIKLALGVNDLDEIGKEMESLFKDLTSPKDNLLQKLQMLPQLGKLNSWLPKKIKGKGVCQEVIHTNPNLSDIPVLKTWPKDGGPFITLPMVNTIDPHTGIRNVGMYRLQVLDATSTGMHWHKHKVGARHYNEYKALNQKMPIAVTLGGDPAYTYASTAPLPDNIDEYMLSGFLRKKKVELVKCITNDIYVPKDVDFVIEGYVDTQEDLIWEGPFGDHTGYYSLADWYPKFHVTCITHKKNAIYPATIVGIPPMEDAYIGKATERIFLTPIKMTMLPEVLDMNLPYAGVAHNITIIKINKSFAGHAHKVINALWGAGQMMFNKIMIVVDKNTNVHNYAEVLKAISKNVDVNSDIVFNKGPLDVLDHAASRFAFGSKMGIDATSKFPEEINTQDSTKQSGDKIEHIVDINDSLKADGLVVVSVEKNKFRFKEWVKQESSKFDTSVKLVVFIDQTIDTNNLFNVTWTASNHIDPIRDSIVENNILFLDGTKKTKAIDGFERQWPNPVVMDKATITTIDQKWTALGLGEFLASPSNYYRPQMTGLEAVAEE